MNLELFPHKAFYLKYTLGQLVIKNSNLKNYIKKHYSESTKPDTKGQILCDPTHMKYLE